MKVVVIGGGPAGLYTALLLRKANPEHSVTVLERNRADDTFGWGVVFSDQTLENFRAADEPTFKAITDNFAPHRIVDELAEIICAFRREPPFWGARKRLRVLADRHPRVMEWPASTTADLLARRGLVMKRRRRRPHQHPGVVAPITKVPNDLWTADFKGEFRTGNGLYCYPLTIADQHTRFLLTCHGLRSTQTVTARPVFERAFREYGLPFAIRTDNGVPTKVLPMLLDTSVTYLPGCSRSSCVFVVPLLSPGSSACAVGFPETTYKPLRLFALSFFALVIRDENDDHDEATTEPFPHELPRRTIVLRARPHRPSSCRCSCSMM